MGKQGTFIAVSDDQEGGSPQLVTKATPLPVDDLFHSIASGEVAGHSLVHKFGKNDEITTDYKPLSHGGLFPTPQVSGGVSLRIKAGGNILRSSY